MIAASLSGSRRVWARAANAPCVVRLRRALHGLPQQQSPPLLLLMPKPPGAVVGVAVGDALQQGRVVLLRLRSSSTTTMS